MSLHSLCTIDAHGVNLKLHKRCTGRVMCRDTKKKKIKKIGELLAESAAGSEGDWEARIALIEAVAGRPLAFPQEETIVPQGCVLLPESDLEV